MKLNFKLNQADLAWFACPESAAYFADITRGVERESLRVTKSAEIAQTDHPRALGSALTHPTITTDFSEALIELVTPPTHSLDELEASLNELHQFVYENLDHEFLWPASMPVTIPDASKIRLAQYGTSNIAKMKQTYRRGLCYRYGKIMQVISGIHYNFSLPKEWFAGWHRHTSKTESLREFIDAAYFKLMRNYLEHYWLLMYLFGASPVCAATSLHDTIPDYLERLDANTYYAPFGTSLRMSGLGYSNSSQACICVSRDNIGHYVRDLLALTRQPYPDYVKIGLKDEQGNYKQLNTNLLQIENEYYSAIRPKQITRPGERPAVALQARGVEYIEVRCLDVNPFLATGINTEQAAFVDVFLLFCLLLDSKQLGLAECQIKSNAVQKVVTEGRKPDLMLDYRGHTISMLDWGHSILDGCLEVANIMDAGLAQPIFVKAVNQQRQKLENSALTPSAQLLATMQNKQCSFEALMLDQAKQYREYFATMSVNSTHQHEWIKLAEESWLKQKQIEQNDTLTFEQFLEQYFMQG